MDDDVYLAEEVKRHIGIGQRKMTLLFCAVELMHELSERTGLTLDQKWSDLACEALEGVLGDSERSQNLTAAIQKCPASQLLEIVTHITTHWPDVEDVAAINHDLANLVNASDSPENILSGYHPKHSTMQTTVSQRKMMLSKSRAKLSQNETAYTMIVDRLCKVLDIYFDRCLIAPATMFLVEILVYDLRLPARDAVTARPRFAIEKALSVPLNYLTSGVTASKSLEKPATAILYQMYLDSGALVNIFDLYNAFCSTMSTGKSDTAADERMKLTLFYQALAELRLLGLVKHSRKKIDHLAKAGWRGL